MSRYLFQATYENAGVKGILAEGGTRRREAAAAAIESVGGTLESFDFAFGDTDALGDRRLPRCSQRRSALARSSTPVGP